MAKRLCPEALEGSLVDRIYSRRNLRLRLPALRSEASRVPRRWRDSNFDSNIDRACLVHSRKTKADSISP